MDKAQVMAGANSSPPPRWPVGGTFIESLALRDFTALADCLDSAARMRAMLPHGPIELTGSDAVAGWLRSLFGGPEDLELSGGTVGDVGHRLYLRWRIRLTPAGGTGPRRLVEQHAFIATDAGARISAVDLLCSGFVTEPGPAA
jgi:hypothetical protein